MKDLAGEPRIAVLVPCYNEEVTIGKVVDDFRRALPEATIYVFDNCCTDETARIAAKHGAQVRRAPRQGKGYVVERMFETVEADYYVMVDGDDTYSAEHVGALLAPVLAGEADMTVGARLAEYSDGAFRPLHVFGNNLVRALVNWVAGASLTDVMSGYRAFNRRVADHLPVVSAGFEVETEMSIQALYLRMAILEVKIPYRERPAGSVSKLRTFRDGIRVLWQIFTLLRAFKPLTFFGAMGLLLFLTGLAAGTPPILDYLTDPNHFVRHVPLAILATGLMILSAGSVFVGVLLHGINWRIREMMNVMMRSRARRREGR